MLTPPHPPPPVASVEKAFDPRSFQRLEKVSLTVANLDEQKKLQPLKK